MSVGTGRECTWSHSSPSFPQASTCSQVKLGLAVCTWSLPALLCQSLWTTRFLFLWHPPSSTSPATYTQPDIPELLQGEGTSVIIISCLPGRSQGHLQGFEGEPGPALADLSLCSLWMGMSPSSTGWALGGKMNYPQVILGQWVHLLCCSSNTLSAALTLL